MSGETGWGLMANEVACSLRKKMTPQEVKLWVHLRSWRRRGFHFRRQAPRDGVIVDFVCLKSRLIIEIDGRQHNVDAHSLRDAKRDDHFAHKGFRTLRFWNNEIDRSLEVVLTIIDDALRAPPPGRAPRGHPFGGGIGGYAAVARVPAEAPSTEIVPPAALSTTTGVSNQVMVGAPP